MLAHQLRDNAEERFATVRCRCRPALPCDRCRREVATAILQWQDPDAGACTADVPQAEMILDDLRDELTGLDPYDGTKFAWIRSLSSRTKGSLGERFASMFFDAMGCSVQRAPTTVYDRIIDGARIEVKASTVWRGTNQLKFSQIRPGDGEYDAFVFIAFTPEGVHVWLVDRETVWSHAEGQHRGKGRATDTRWLDVHLDDLPTWFGTDLTTVKPDTVRRKLRALRS